LVTSSTIRNTLIHLCRPIEVLDLKMMLLKMSSEEISVNMDL